MPLSTTTFVGDNSQTSFTLTGFKLPISGGDLTVTNALGVPLTNWTYTNGVLNFTAAPAAGTYTVSRDTGTDVKVDFVPGSVSASDLDLAYLQNLLLIEETKDRIEEVNTRVSTLTAGPGGTTLPGGTAINTILMTGSSPFNPVWQTAGTLKTVLGLDNATSLPAPGAAGAVSATGWNFVMAGGGTYRVATAGAITALLGIRELGTVIPNASVTTAVTNATNAANGLVALDSSGRLTALDGRNLTNVKTPRVGCVVRKRSLPNQNTGSGVAAPTVTGTAPLIATSAWQSIPTGSSTWSVLTVNTATEWGGTLPTVRLASNSISLPKGRYRVTARHNAYTGVATWSAGGTTVVDNFALESRARIQGFANADLTGTSDTQVDVTSGIGSASLLDQVKRFPVTCVYTFEFEYTGIHPWFGLTFEHRVVVTRNTGSVMNGLVTTNMYSTNPTSTTNHNLGSSTYDNDIIEIERIG